MTVACVQYNPKYLQVDENLDAVGALIYGIDADLVVLPELFASGYFFRSMDDVRAVAELVPAGPTTRRLQNWAREYGTTIVAGLPERDGDRFYNGSIVVTPSGEVHRYRKVHLFYREKDFFQPGDLGFPVFNLTDRKGNAYRIGVMICFDWYFPESARSLALSGADVIAHPSNLVRKDCPRSMPIRALENHVFTATANRIGAEHNGVEEVSFIGQSLICDPAGQVLASAQQETTEIIFAQIDPHEARNRRITDTNDLFLDRRPEVYFAG